jgi:hypothetical protein
LVSDTIFKSKLRPCRFDLSAAAQTWLRLASRNASHIDAVAIRKAVPANDCRFGATSCRAFQFQINAFLIWNWNEKRWRAHSNK